MFPLTPTIILGEMTSDLHRDARRRPLGRLEIERLKLEHQPMYHLNTMSVDVARQEAELALRNRQQLALARGESVSQSSRIRGRIASIFFSIGSRIQGTDVSTEPRYNA